MKSIFIKIETYLIGKKRYQPFFEMLHRISLRGMNYSQAMSTSNSGEINAMKFASSKLANEPIIFDVGANVGSWTKEALDIFNNPKCYLFEPSSILTSRLQERYSENSNIKYFAIGLSDKEGELKLYNSGDSTATSFPLEDELSYEFIKVNTINNICKQEGINEISYLKIDVEGNEYNILNGCIEMIQSNKIKFIQFEFGANTIESRIFLKDFYSILSNYKIYKIIKDGIVEWNYSLDREIQLPTNFLAELQE